MTDKHIPFAREVNEADLFTKYEKQAIAMVREYPLKSTLHSLSFLGGTPHLPVAQAWPRKSTGEPLHFIAQIDCSALPKTEPDSPSLPDEGALFFFADMSDGSGWYDDEYSHDNTPENWRVLYSSTLTKAPVSAPSDLSIIGGEYSPFLNNRTLRPGETFNTYYKWRLFPRLIKDYPLWYGFEGWWELETDVEAQIKRVSDLIKAQYLHFTDITTTASTLNNSPHYNTPHFIASKFDETFLFPDIGDEIFPYVYLMVEDYARFTSYLIDYRMSKNSLDPLLSAKVGELKSQLEAWILWAQSRGIYNAVSHADKQTFQNNLFEYAKACPLELQKILNAGLSYSWWNTFCHIGDSQTLTDNIPPEILALQRGNVRHQMLGYTPHADHITHDFNCEILFSIQSDDLAMMQFGDLDRLEFRIRPEDLKSRSFDKAYAVIG